MKRLAPALLLLVLWLLPHSKACPQSNYQLHFGPSIPLSEYGVYPIITWDEDYLASGAIGLDAGFQYNYQWSKLGFGVYASADFIVGRVDKDWVNKCYEMTFYLDLEQLPVYLYFPLSAGLSYKYEISSTYSLTAFAGMTYNQLKVTDNMWENANRETDWTSAFGIKAGAGVLFRGKIPLLVNYLGLGKHEITEYLIHATDPRTETRELNVHMLTITTGWVF